jgi:hypothetical protein
MLTKPSDMLDHALAYASRGWPVFALNRMSKVPIKDSAAYKDATCDEALIRAMWQPDARRNIALASGRDGGFWVLDLDSDKKTGRHGRERLMELEAEFGRLPDTPRQRTPSGGNHLFFAWPDDGLDLPRSIRFDEGMDALGERVEKGEVVGGYLVVAPSARKDGVYEWDRSIADVDPPQAPKWLLDRIRERWKKSERAPSYRPSSNGGTSRYGRTTLINECARVAANMSHQHTYLFRASAEIGNYIAGGEINEAEAYPALLNAARQMVNTNPNKPWYDKQLHRTIVDGLKKGMISPKSAPPLANGYVHHDPETGEIYEDEPIHEEDDPPKEEKKKEKPSDPVFDNVPFRMLGHNRGTYFYLPIGGGQIVGLRSHEHTPLRLLAIAPLNYWYSARRSNLDGPITAAQWQHFANGLIHAQHDEGIFEEIRIRGRGAWMDGKRVVVHTGSEIIVEGEAIAITKINSRFVYEAAPPWEFGFSDPATTAEAHRLVEVCDRLTWEDNLSGALLAGWCVLAPVSGALKWRPHIWNVGPTGSGKSTVQTEIVGRVVGPAAIKFDGKTTEAAMRQNMGFDARPVLLDEAEGEDTDAAKRMQAILDLARVSSSGGVVSKGSSTHRAVNFVVRSCFCFSSIHASIRFQADESRITKLALRRNSGEKKDEHFRELMIDINAWFTPEYASRMFARTVKYLPTLLKNVEIFTSVASIVLGSRRAADQLGGMLAGLYLCHSPNMVTLQNAEAFIRKHKWNEHLSLDSQDDEVRLFRYLMSRSMRVLTNDGPREFSIGQMIDEGQHTRELAAMGIKSDGVTIFIATSSDRLAEVLKEKPNWQADWKSGLMRLPGAGKTPAPIYFAPGLNARAVTLPRELLRG